jgi:hypothetical protein
MVIGYVLVMGVSAPILAGVALLTHHFRKKLVINAVF